jgi:putative Holliday junction resolvase
MALFNMRDLRAGLAHKQRLMGIDPGSKTIGLALSDVGLMLASPYGSLKRGKLKANAAEIAAIARKQDVGGLVVGLPLSMDGTLGPAAQAARDWALALSEVTGLPVALWDERLSSSAVNRFLVEEVDLTRKRRAEAVDRAAAAWMLQAALDASRGTVRFDRSRSVTCARHQVPVRRPPLAAGPLPKARRRRRRPSVRRSIAPVPATPTRCHHGRYAPGRTGAHPAARPTRRPDAHPPKSRLPIAPRPTRSRAGGSRAGIRSDARCHPSWTDRS